jgi:hypothetical protein
MMLPGGARAGVAMGWVLEFVAQLGGGRFFSFLFFS